MVVNQLIRDFSREFEITAVIGGRGRVAEACEKQGIRVHSIAIDRLWKCGWGFFQLLFLLRRIKPDVLFLHGQWAGPLGAVAGWLEEIPVIIYVAHSPAFYHRQTLKNSIRSYFSERLPGRLAHASVALSEGNHYQYLIRQWVDESRLHLIHNGLDLKDAGNRDGAGVRTRWEWNPAHRHVLFLGRLDRQKGLTWLLEAWRLVLAGRSGVELWVVGSGPMEAEARQLAKKLGLDETCHFLPDQPDGPEFIAAADVVVLPSLYEGHALVPLEVMAAGKAFAGTRVDGIVDSIRHGREGFLAAPADVKGLAEALGRLLDDPVLCGELGRNGLERIKDFDWERSFRRYDALVQSLWEGRKKRIR